AASVSPEPRSACVGARGKSASPTDATTKQTSGNLLKATKMKEQSAASHGDLGPRWCQTPSSPRPEAYTVSITTPRVRAVVSGLSPSMQQHATGLPGSPHRFSPLSPRPSGAASASVRKRRENRRSWAAVQRAPASTGQSRGAKVDQDSCGQQETWGRKQCIAGLPGRLQLSLFSPS